MTDKEELKRRLASSSRRILLIGDIHLRDNPPRNCTDAYLEDIFDILKFTVQLETAFKADAVVWAGDVFDHKMPSRTSHRLVQRAQEVVQAYKNLIIVDGNHDIQNDRLESVLDTQPLGVLYRSGAKRLEGWDFELPIYGVPWQQRWAEPGRVEEVFRDWRVAGGDEEDPRDLESSLVVTHCSLFPVGEEPIFEHVPTPAFADAMGNKGSVYYGHIHDDQGIYHSAGVTFCNPGAISRGSLTESNQSRKVKAALWTPEHGFLEIDLPHLPAEEIYLLEQAAGVKDKKISDERFLQEVGTTRLEISSTAGVISHIQGLTDVEPPVKATAIELLELQA